MNSYSKSIELISNFSECHLDSVRAHVLHRAQIELKWTFPQTKLAWCGYTIDAVVSVAYWTLFMRSMSSIYADADKHTACSNTKYEIQHTFLRFVYGRRCVYKSTRAFKIVFNLRYSVYIIRAADCLLAVKHYRIASSQTLRSTAHTNVRLYQLLDIITCIPSHIWAPYVFGAHNGKR